MLGSPLRWLGLQGALPFPSVPPAGDQPPACFEDFSGRAPRRHGVNDDGFLPNKTHRPFPYPFQTGRALVSLTHGLIPQSETQELS